MFLLNNSPISRKPVRKGNEWALAAEFFIRNFGLSTLFALSSMTEKWNLTDSEEDSTVFTDKLKRIIEKHDWN